MIIYLIYLKSYDKVLIGYFNNIFKLIVKI